MTETTWASWLRDALEQRGWTQARLVRESGGLIKADRVSKWLSGKETPSHRLTLVTANTLHAAQSDALDAAGFVSVPEHIRREHADVLTYERSPQGLVEMDERFTQHELGEALSSIWEPKSRLRILREFSTSELLAEVGRRADEHVGPRSDYGRAARPREMEPTDEQ